MIGLEIDALMKEHETTLKNIASYEDILNNYKSMAKVIIRELDALKKEYAAPRRPRWKMPEKPFMWSRGQRRCQSGISHGSFRIRQNGGCVCI